MSFAISVHDPTSAAALGDAVRAAWEDGDTDRTDEHDRLVAAAAEAVDAFARNVDRPDVRYVVTVSGHANVGWEHVDGMSGTTLTVSISEAAADG